MASFHPTLARENYISLCTFRKDGNAVPTPVWFAEHNGTLLVMTRDNSFKIRRIRNNPAVQVAPCSMRGRVTGPYQNAAAAILPPSEWPAARRLLARKYWLMRLTFLWSKHNLFLAIRYAIHPLIHPLLHPSDG